MKRAARETKPGTPHTVVRVRLDGQRNYDIGIGRGALESLGEVARASLAQHARSVALISNPRVFDLYGAQAIASLRAAGWHVTQFLMGEGERYKSLPTAERALAHLSAAELERSDAVVALGGGVVGDLAGFVAAIYLRGIAFIQVPTTLLAQIDSSVGGKTGINTQAGKNLVGAFHQPRAVVIDTETLLTLPARELTAGWCEAIKQGAIGDRKLFEQTRSFLESETRHAAGAELQPGPARRTARRQADSLHDVRAESRQPNHEQAREARFAQLSDVIAAQCAFKARIVSQDEHEDALRNDARSRRILNFGHTVGHALEKLTNYRRFRHGEAVGYGMLAAAEISHKLGLLASSELESLKQTVRLAGRFPRASDLDEAGIMNAIRYDKKAVGGHVQWVLLEGLGGARIVSGKEIPTRVVKESLRVALQQT